MVRRVQARRGGRPGRLHHLPGRHDERAAGQAAGAARAELGGRHGQQGAGRRGRPRVHRLPATCCKKAAWVGNPLRAGLPAAARRRPSAWPRAPARCRLLVVGGSLGAKALNEIVPKALALIPAEQRPSVLHQSGAKQIDELRANYAAAGVQAELTPFIDDTAQRLRRGRPGRLPRRRQHGDRDRRRRRGGACSCLSRPPWTTTRPPTRKFLVDAGGGWLVQQRELTPAVAGRPAAARWTAPSCCARAMAAKSHAEDRAPRADVVARLRGAGAHETRHQAHSLRRHRRRRHVRHRRGAAQPGLPDLRLRPVATARRCAAWQAWASRPSSATPPANIAGADAVVTSTAVQADNPEVVAAREAQDPGRAARDDAGRADAPEAGHRHRRHARQDDHHQPGGQRAGRRRARSRPS